MELAEYQERFRTAAVSRDEAGVLTIRMHSREQSLWWGDRPHRELPELFAAVASDRENRVVVLTGTGERFITLLEGPGLETLPKGRASVATWDQIIWEGNRLVHQMLDIEVPVIVAVNGPVTVHSELAVLGDVVLATPDTYFQDQAHFPMGLVPGDSMQVVWPMLLGPNRGRAFLLMGKRLDAEEALALGVIAEIVPRPDIVTRAHEIAARLASCNPILLRNTRHALVRPIKRAMAEDLHTGLALEALASLSAKDWFDETGDNQTNR